MTPAYAHKGSDHASEALGWSFEPWVVWPLLVLAVLYAAGSSRLARRGSVDRWRSAVLFWAGFATLALALMSPLHAYGTRLFSAHMIEHEIMMIVAVPLMVAARPGPVLLWGVPDGWRQPLMRLFRRPPLGWIWRAGTELTSATLLHTAVIWVWHVPSFFEAAVRNEGLHVIQHLSFVVSAAFFWIAVLDRDQRRHGQGAAVLALFFTSIQAALLGALLTFSTKLWYPNGPDPMELIGMTRSEDQALAGLIMWIPACSLYVVAALILMARWLMQMDQRHA
jgi:cytochrome c oxidase assembly factor CtaG